MRLRVGKLNQRDDAGVATILLVLCSTLLLAGLSIAVDVGRAVAVARSAQNSADAVTLAMAKDCVERGGLSAGGYDGYIRTTAAIGNGQTQSLTAGSCSAGSVTATARETVNYSFAKVIGMTRTTKSRSATAKWSQLSSGVIFPFTFSACAFPDSFTTGNATTPGTPLMLYGQVNRTSCGRDANASGQSSNSKGFVTDGCVLKSLSQTLHDANGNSFTGTSCASSSLDYYVGKDVLLPVWGSATGGGGGSDYTITNLVGFHVLGWSGNGSNFGGAMTARCKAGTFTGDPTTLGDNSKPCLYGYVTSFVSTAGGTTGASCTTGALRSACFVYLDS
jgi:Flp pilus assembly protein TadG